MLPDISNTPVVNESSVEELMGRDNNGESLLKRLFSIYCSETPRLLIELETAVLTQNLELVYDTIHQLKGSSAAMGADRVYALTEAMLGICSSGAILKVDNLVALISVETDAYISELNDRLSR